MMMNAILHETGHVLGLGHTTCPGKVMYREGQQGVTTKDSEACQVLNKIYVTPEEEEEQPGSPLVFDLDGDGIGTTAVDVSPVYFDLDADGAVDELGWIAPRTPDAFLWLDLNANGAVDNGAELFGNFTQLPDGQRAENGFEALAQYDLPELGGNGDGRINSDDNIWLRLALWSDWNHDGLTLRSEITPLSESGVIAISLRYTPRGWIDEQGNLHRGIGRFWARNASGRGRVTGHVEDLWFRMR
jgi:hypothetical protein